MLAYLAALLLSAGPVAAATPAPTPAPRLFTSEMAGSVTRFARAMIEERRAPGIAVAIVEDGRIVYERGFGYADERRRVPYTPQTQIYAGDLSRAFTAAAVLMLQQDGKLRLDEKVTKYVPALTAAKSLTIEGLLRQQSGLPEMGRLEGIAHDQRAPISEDAVIAAIDRAGIADNPAPVENPLNYYLAAIVAERAAGFPYSDFLQQRIFAPLIMNETLVAGDIGGSMVATGYTGSIGQFVPAHSGPASRLTGSSDVITTVADLEKWDVDFPILLRVDAVRQMFTGATAQPGNAQLGMGWWIDQRGGKRYVWQNARTPGYRAMNALLPDDHVAVIVTTNADDARDGRVASPELLASRILDVIDPPRSKQLDNAVVSRATDWLARLAQRRIDRTQLTPAFSAYLTDELVAKENIASLGTVQAIVPVASFPGDSGDTVYEFVVRFTHDTYRYRFAVTPDGKIDGLVLAP